MNGRARLQTFFTNETRVPRDGGGPPARAPLPALPARTMPRRRELGHYDDYHDRHPRNGSAPCLDDALLRAPLTPSTSRERSTARLGPHPAGARTLRRLPRPGGTELRQGFLTLSPGHSYPDVLRPAMFDRCQKTYIILFVLAPPSSVAFAAPAVPAVAVPAGGGSYAGVLGGAG